MDYSITDRRCAQSGSDVHLRQNYSESVSEHRIESFVPLKLIEKMRELYCHPVSTKTKRINSPRLYSPPACHEIVSDIVWRLIFSKNHMIFLLVATPMCHSMNFSFDVISLQQLSIIWNKAAINKMDFYYPTVYNLLYINYTRFSKACHPGNTAIISIRFPWTKYLRLGQVDWWTKGFLIKHSLIHHMLHSLWIWSPGRK